MLVTDLIRRKRWREHSFVALMGLAADKENKTAAQKQPLDL
jgi:hypothetical protein